MVPAQPREKKMSNASYGAQVQQIAADQALRDNYFNTENCHLGQRVPYRNETDETDDRAWSDAEGRLRQRDMKLHDHGSGYVIATTRFSPGDRVTADDDAGRIVDYRSCDEGGCDIVVGWDSGVRTPASSADLVAE